MNKKTKTALGRAPLVAGITAVLLGLTFGPAAMAETRTSDELNSNTSKGHENSASTFNKDEHSAYDWDATKKKGTDTVNYKASAALDKKVMATLQKCKALSASCASTTKNAVGILVFPSVVSADLIVGGAGGKGALVENGRITGYYNIGAATAGLQAGVDNASQVYVFRTREALRELKAGSSWNVGATAGVTLVTADAAATSTAGDILTYVFDSEGLQAGISLGVFNVWKANQPRPRYDDDGTVWKDRTNRNED